jgi:hypothetical protein
VACFIATEASAQVAGGAAAGGAANGIGVTLDTARMVIVVDEFEAPVIAPVRKPRPAPKPRVERAAVTVEEDGSMVAVRVTASAASLSEPIHGDGRVRLYLTLPGASAPVLPDSAGPGGLIGLRLEEGDDGVRLAIDASSLSGYRLETGATGLTLWLETAPAAVRASTDNNIAAGTTEVAFEGTEAVATATDGRAMTRALANGLAIGVRATGALAWNGIRAAAGRTVAATRSATSNIGGFTSRSVSAIRTALEDRNIEAPRPEIIGVLTGLIVASVMTWLSLRKRSHRRTWLGSHATKRQRHAESAPSAAKNDSKSSPAMNGSPAVWAARTMAGQGMDAASIARRTGIARDAAVLLVTGARRNVPDPAASSPSLLAAVAAGPIPVEALI